MREKKGVGGRRKGRRGEGRRVGGQKERRREGGRKGRKKRGRKEGRRTEEKEEEGGMEEGKSTNESTCERIHVCSHKSCTNSLPVQQTL